MVERPVQHPILVRLNRGMDESVPDVLIVDRILLSSSKSPTGDTNLHLSNLEPS